jgi:hypothetical protein
MAHKLDGAHAGLPLCITRLRLRMALTGVVCPTRITLGKIGAVIVREVYTSGKEGSMGVC